MEHPRRVTYAPGVLAVAVGGTRSATPFRGERGVQHQHHDHHSRELRTGHPIFDIGDDAGAVVFFTTPELRWQEIEIYPADMPDAKTHTEVTERLVVGTIIYTGIFPPLPIGDYTVCRPPERAGEIIKVVSGRVTEVDWR